MWEGLSHTKEELESHSSGLLRPQGPNLPISWKSSKIQALEFPQLLLSGAFRPPEAPETRTRQSLALPMPGAARRRTRTSSAE